VTTILAPSDFVRELSPRYLPMPHLAPLFSLFERIAAGEQVRAVTSFPPRFGKTEAILHCLVWLFLLNPELQVMFGSYGQRLAESKSARTRKLAALAGVPLAEDTRSKATWATVGLGKFWAMGIGGAATGEGADVLVIDDPHKGRAEAESATIREAVFQCFRADWLTRLEPHGSVIANLTRWHADDLAGRLLADGGWETINVPALTPAGESIWPERWPTETLLRKQAELGGPQGLEWLSLFMGTPPARGTRVFHDSHFYDERPATFDRITIGVDFAYSAKTHADWSVAVVLGHSAGKYYVLDVVRAHLEIREFRARVQALATTFPGAMVCAYAAATERGGIEFLREGGLAVSERTAREDKFSRAIPTQAAWNNGQILIPRTASWGDAFVSEIASFTGTKADRHDDQVDALAAAFDGLTGGFQYQQSTWTDSDWSSAIRGVGSLHGSWGGGGSTI
jgi:predicted phage terminase large subunit-like protein